MDIKEKAEIIALARLLGSTITDGEILNQYAALYQDAISRLSQSSGPAKVEVFKRPF